MQLTFDGAYSTILSYSSNGPFVFESLQRDTALGLVVAKQSVFIDTNALYKVNYPNLVSVSAGSSAVHLSMTDDHQQLQVIFKSAAKAGEVAFHWQFLCPPFESPAQLSYQGVADIRLSTLNVSSYGGRLDGLLQAHEVDASKKATYLLDFPEGWGVRKVAPKQAAPNPLSMRDTYSVLNKTGLQICPEQSNYEPERAAVATLLVAPYRPEFIQAAFPLRASYQANVSFQPPTAAWVGLPLQQSLMLSWPYISRLSSTVNTSLLDSTIVHTVDNQVLLQLQVLQQQPVTGIPYQIHIKDIVSGCPLKARLPSDPQMPIEGQISSYSVPKLSQYSHPLPPLYYDRGAQPLQNISFSGVDQRLGKVALQLGSIQAMYFDGARYLFNHTFSAPNIGRNLSEINRYMQRWRYYFSTVDQRVWPNQVQFFANIAFHQQPLTRIALSLGNSSLEIASSIPVSGYSVAEWLLPFHHSHFDLCFNMRIVDFESIMFSTNRPNINSDGYHFLSNYSGGRLSGIVWRGNNDMCARFVVSFWSATGFYVRYRYKFQFGEDVQDGHITLQGVKSVFLGTVTVPFLALLVFRAYRLYSLYEDRGDYVIHREINRVVNSRKLIARKFRRGIRPKLKRLDANSFISTCFHGDEGAGGLQNFTALINANWRLIVAMLLGRELRGGGCPYQLRYRRMSVNALFDEASVFLARYKDDPTPGNAAVAHAFCYALSVRKITEAHLLDFLHYEGAGTEFLHFIYHYARLIYAHDPNNRWLQALGRGVRKTALVKPGDDSTENEAKDVLTSPFNISVRDIRRVVKAVNVSGIDTIASLVKSVVVDFLGSGSMLAYMLAFVPDTATIQSYLSQGSFFWLLPPILALPGVIYRCYRTFAKRHTVSGVYPDFLQRAALFAVRDVFIRAKKDSRELHEKYKKNHVAALGRHAGGAPDYFFHILVGDINAKQYKAFGNNEVNEVEGDSDSSAGLSIFGNNASARHETSDRKDAPSFEGGSASPHSSRASAGAPRLSEKTSLLGGTKRSDERKDDYTPSDYGLG